MKNKIANINVEICMGSSCFARANDNTLKAITDFIEKNNLQTYVNLKGNLCQGKCRVGPNLKINEQLYNHCDPAAAIDLLKHHLNSSADNKEKPE